MVGAHAPSTRSSSRWIAAAGSACVLLASVPVLAQTFFLPEATLRVGDVAVGQVEGLRASRLEWPSARRASLRFADGRLELAAAVDLASRDTYVAAGVGLPVELQETGPWHIRMLADSWAPVLEGGARGVRVALPDWLPVRDGWLPAGSPPTDGEAHLPWAVGAAGGDPCPDLVVFAAVDGGPSLRVPQWAGVQMLGRGKGLQPVEVRMDGFSVQGFATSPIKCGAAPGSIGLSGFGTGCGDGRGWGRVVRLPAGTRLFSPKVHDPFAVLRQAAPGIELAHEARRRICGPSSDCRLEPPLPKGPAEWIVPFEAGPEPHFVLRAWVDVPAEQLPDDPSNPGGFGLCFSPPDHWPRLPAR